MHAPKMTALHSQASYVASPVGTGKVDDYAQMHMKHEHVARHMGETTTFCG